MNPLWTLGMFLVLIGAFAACLLALEQLFRNMRDFEDDEDGDAQ